MALKSFIASIRGVKVWATGAVYTLGKISDVLYFDGCSMVDYKNQSLYGGAITTKIPSGLLDASQIRPVDDTQEIFVNATNSGLGSDDSLMFDLLERVAVEEGPDAIEYHYRELAEMNDSKHEQIMSCEKINSSLGDGYILTTIAVPGVSESQGTMCGMVLGLLRDEEHKTDILVTVNVPISERFISSDKIFESTAVAERLEVGKHVVRTALSNFVLVNEGLFG